jgi:hypothetical protein
MKSPGATDWPDHDKPVEGTQRARGTQSTAGIELQDLGRLLRGTNERMMDTAREEEGHPIGIKAPHQCPNTQRCSVRRDDLQPHDAPGTLVITFAPWLLMSMIWQG